MKYKILQITSARESDTAIYTADENELHAIHRRVVCWALVEWEDKSRDIIGMVTVGKRVVPVLEPADENHTFWGYKEWK